MSTFPFVTTNFDRVMVLPSENRDAPRDICNTNRLAYIFISPVLRSFEPLKLLVKYGVFFETSSFIDPLSTGGLVSYVMNGANRSSFTLTVTWLNALVDQIPMIALSNANMILRPIPRS